MGTELQNPSHPTNQDPVLARSVGADSTDLAGEDLFVGMNKSLLEFCERIENRGSFMKIEGGTMQRLSVTESS